MERHGMARHGRSGRTGIEPGVRFTQTDPASAGVEEETMSNQAACVCETAAVYEGVPVFFRAFVLRRELGAGGYHFGGATPGMLWRAGDDDEAAIDDLQDRLRAGDRLAVLAWYKVRFPSVLAAIPMGWQRREFLNGVFQAYDEDRINL